MTIADLINSSIETKQKLLDESYTSVIEQMGKIMVKALRRGNKILLAGNGGSAADAQHFAGELVGKFLRKKREALPAIALTTDPSVLTAISNDFGFEKVFARQIEALGRAGDIFLGISTTGNSANLIRAARIARTRGLQVLGILGKDGGELKSTCDISLIVPSRHTQRIQECHTLIIHLLSEIIEHAYGT